MDVQKAKKMKAPEDTHEPALISASDCRVKKE